MKKSFGKILATVLVVCLLSALLSVAVVMKGTAAPSAVGSQSYTFKNVHTGAGGGFIVDVLFHPKQQNLIYAKTDMGGAYRSTDGGANWTQMFNFVSSDNWSWTGMESLAVDPSNANIVYAAGGTYVNSWDPHNGVIWRSSDQGNTWAFTQLPFKMGGNMNGRGMGERLAVDPNKGSVLYFGARNGNGLWKSTNSGVTWAKVTNFPDVGTFVANATDPNGYLLYPVGITWVIFDPHTGTTGNASQTIYVGVATNSSGSNNIYRSTDGGATWAAIPGEPTCTGAWGGTVTCSGVGHTWTAGAQNSYTGGGVGFLPHEGKLDTNGTLYVTYSDWEGPYNGGNGAIWKYVPSTNTWTDISPASSALPGGQYFGYGGLGIDTLHPGTLVVAAVNSWWPDGQMFRSTDGGATWKDIWTYNGYPSVTRQFSMNVSSAPWLAHVGASGTSDPTPPFMMGWMMEGLNIDPFNSAKMMYGTGATLYGTTNLTAWDTGGVVNISSMANGMEETSVGDLISPPSGTPHLISAVGDVGGFVHTSLDTVPTIGITSPCGCGIPSIDFAENNPSDMVTVATGDSSATPAHTGAGFTTNGGANWFNSNVDPVQNSGGGTVAMAADASSVVWAGTTAPVSYTTTFGSSWSPSANIPAGSVVASDRVTATKFYGLGGGKFWVSTDGGKTFTATAATGLPNSGNLKAVFGHAGDVWLTGSTYISGGGTVCAPVCGLWHSTNSGATFTKISTVTSAASIGFGLGPTAGSYSIFMFGVPTGGINTIYRSDDQGATWLQITDTQHMFATIQTITGDPRIYGRVYFGTNGLGMFYGDISGTQSATSTPTKTFTPGAATNTATSTPSKTSTRTNTPTVDITRVLTFTPTRTPTVGITNTPTRTATAGPSLTPTRTNTAPAITSTPTRTLTPSITPTAGSGSACSPVTSTITVPFTFDGAGVFCWQASALGTYINSWNTTSVSLNGVNITNIYVASGSFPAKIGGFYYIGYNSSVAWGHLEAK